MFLNIQIDLIILKTYDQQFTFTTKKSLHITFKWWRQALIRRGPSLHPSKCSAQSSAYVCCGQTAGWIKIPTGMEVCLGPGDILLDGDPPSPALKGAQEPPLFGPSIVAKRSRISATAELLLFQILLSDWHPHKHYTVISTRLYSTSEYSVKAITGTSSAIHSWLVWWPNVVKQTCMYTMQQTQNCSASFY